MSCGCNKYYPFSSQHCSGSRYPECEPAYGYLVLKFTVPDVLTDVAIEVTNTAGYYLGQGVKIGDYFWQITEITDSTHLKIQHTDTTIEGEVVSALNSVYGCYQTAVYPVGSVNLIDEDFTPLGYANDGTSLIASSVVSIGSGRKLKYGYLGPSTIKFSVQFDCTIANSPYWISIPVPGITASEISFEHDTNFSASYYNGTNIVGLATWAVHNGKLLMGPGNGSTFSNGSSRIFRATGIYETYR